MAVLNKIYECYKEIFGYERFAKNKFLGILFNTKNIKNLTGGGNADCFNYDVIIKPLVPKITETYKELIEYYETKLYKHFDKKDGKKVLFEVLRDGVYQYVYDEDFLWELKCRNEDCLYKRNQPCLLGSKTPAEKLLKYYNNVLNSSEIDNKTFACGVYSFLYFLEKGNLPELYLDELNGLSKDRKEFFEEVVLKYGCSGNPGVHRIYNLANRKVNPNSIALYEAAELDYYGKGISGKPNYQSSYDFCIKAVECENFNPLAAWALGYMIYNYDNDENPIYHSDIKQMKSLSFEGRIELAIKYLKKSYDCGCPAAANVIGLILRDKKIANSLKEELQKKYNLEKDYFFYFKMASDAGYSYAKNNLFKYYLEEEGAHIGDTNFGKAYRYLKASADLGNVYAMNKYAREYLWGYMIKGRRDNPKKLKWQALEYFDAAAALFDSWAAFNILSFYSLDENGVEMIKRLPRINGEEELFKKYIIKLHEICDETTKEDFKKKYDAWLVENGEVNKRHK